uniref:ribosomal protein L2 n=1 Tax=Balanophora yakushimensis TaxID=1128105 RepID=UPI002000EC7F|nr:ribosomal protein L2 [Balanophora yakushimensis]UNQ87790.1 ribosomal protein L2 [Balanophora yakushimensis]
MIFLKKNNNNFNIIKWFYKKGKNSSGIIILKYRNIGHKNLYRKIIINYNNYKNIYNKFKKGKIITIEYDPNRNSYICFINIYYYNYNNIYNNKKIKKKFILYIYGLKIGNIIKFIENNKNNNIKIGNIFLLKNIPIGTIISNIKIKKNYNNKLKILVKSAGCFSKILLKNNNSISLKLPSKKIFQIFSNKYYANIGQIGNLKFKNKKYLKAGCKCWIGKKSIVRGSAMNPVDHPHGGGKGKSSIGKKKPSTFWGYKKK